jgi:hypothetical protein
LERHPSLDDRFDPAVRIVDHDPAWLRGLDGGAGPAAKPILDLQLSVAAMRDFLRSHPEEVARGQGRVRHRPRGARCS